ncbi:MAG TPA: pyridoxamine 5'-phosphate oxidase family protein [Acidimicrobiales bacterium]|nr:pyridoxamine 5'-phosphate oxidase family protein [Acidimicrobiales bacterium]
MTESDLAALARAIIDGNAYLTLATSDAAGRPWASPVYFGADGYGTYYWMSLPGARHSRNLAERPELGMVVFDSTVAPGTGQAVYMAATAAEVPGSELGGALAAYPGPARRGVRPVGAGDLTPPAPHRLYRAVVTEHSVLCPRTVPGAPCALHGRPLDHRTAVVL